MMVGTVSSCTQQQKPSEDSTQSIAEEIEIMEIVFTAYAGERESTDSPANKEAIKSALQNLDTSLNEESLRLIIDVWMYYDPTDFPTRDLAENVLFKNRESAIKAIEYRINNMREWESIDSAPYNELQ